MTTFLVIGGIGLALLVTTLLLSDVFDLFDGLDVFDVFDGVDADAGAGWLSGPVVGGFLAALGFGGAIAQAGGLSLATSAVIGAAAGVGMGWITVRVSRFFMDMPTDPTPRTDDLFGHTGSVVTAIPADGLGEVTVRAGGQLHKLYARADQPIAAGTAVVVVEITSATSVKVAAESSWFGSAA